VTLRLFYMLLKKSWSLWKVTDNVYPPQSAAVGFRLCWPSGGAPGIELGGVVGIVAGHLALDHGQFHPARQAAMLAMCLLPLLRFLELLASA
jgi:hypothetical protein